MTAKSYLLEGGRLYRAWQTFCNIGLHVSEMGSHSWVLSSRWTFAFHKVHIGCYVENGQWEIMKQNGGPSNEPGEKGVLSGQWGVLEVESNGHIVGVHFKVE